ncbi:DNA-binding transcriptional regulator, XRE-family HTH domain [Lampropedia hyalina DSM 16112]|jgi:transcriptional regulator with XRE-family HTH domain|uniref:DNA-binding transcriptional regulator, XRE-family HTH domain n=1 Tax=Lampropedia hyalina DSM 16112 TaxID=1122156 RepID=A0A1M4XU50_9BURK|nr:helix-turn-helix transcriptional regulator [Lampropedia hyalina]SHE96920.1 DNA-binding transcriptional regulator, XRE-family HTH domain [Lampropedia hyalina DSM 16112]
MNTGVVFSSTLVENFGITVRQLRERQGWSQEELAGHSGLNRSYIGEIERGRVVPSVVTVEKLALAFNASVTEVFAHCEAIEKRRRSPFAESSSCGM